MLYNEIKECRICGNTDLDTIISLGDQALTGVFPAKDEEVESGPLDLVKCRADENGEFCGLLQLKHNYDLEKLYGENYGYRSGLNNSMVKHLHGIVEEVKGKVDLQKGDLVIDIAGNDSTLLQAYSNDLELVSIDPTSEKFSEYYPEHIRYIPDFFSSEIVQRQIGKKAKVVTSIAMFYDLASPISFMRQIHDILEDDGIWVFEQSYMPLMIDQLAYDTICHEHLEYYALKQIDWMAGRAGLKIIDVSFNGANGGSFRVTVAKKDSEYEEATELVQKILKDEKDRGFDAMEIYNTFTKNVETHKQELLDFFARAKEEGKTIFGYGASTKGNVILQYCGLTTEDMPGIAEINEYKFGRRTPGSNILIMSEDDAKAMKPDYFMVLPWHFRDNIVSRETEWTNNGGKLFFPLPKPEVV